MRIWLVTLRHFVKIMTEAIVHSCFLQEHNYDIHLCDKKKSEDRFYEVVYEDKMCL